MHSIEHQLFSMTRRFLPSSFATFTLMLFLFPVKIIKSFNPSFPKKNFPRYFSGARIDSPYTVPSTVNNVILFDGVCNFCNKWVDFLLLVDRKKVFSFTALQSESGKKLLQQIGKDRNDISSVVYIKKLDASNTEVYYKSDAALKVMEQLGIGTRILSNTFSFLPLQFRDSVYDVVAFNRYNILGKREACRCGDTNSADRFL